MRPVLVPTLLLVLAAPLAAQAPRPRPAAPRADAAAVRRALETITEADVRARISLLAHDSMRGRDTPSPELEETAAWIAAEFQRFGLRPGGENGTFFQRYAVRRTRMDSTSFVMAEGRGAHGHWMLGRDAGMLGTLGGTMPEGPVSGPLVLVTGSPANLTGVNLRGAVVLHLSALSPAVQSLVQAGREAGARAWIIAQPNSAAAQAAQARSAMRPQQSTGSAAAGAPGVPVFTIRDSAAAGLLQAAGLDLATLKAGPPSVRALDGVTGAMNLRRIVLSEATAPNVIGVLEGSDPALRGEYVFYSAHMDHVGVGQPVNGDSIYNGADDDASGTAGVVELAEAFSRLQPRPRRSIVFMTVSGEEHGLWGSEYYSEHPTMPLTNTVADLNLDMIGRNWTDTISVIGKEHSTLGEVANRVAREHPELRMNLVDDLWPSENFYFRSDHYNFARKGVPILFFFNGTHPDYHRPSDTVDRIDAEKEMRILRMVFHVGLEVANTTERPQWNAESYRRIVQQNATP